jgi:purine-binding chemotaxis protein CheW
MGSMGAVSAGKLLVFEAGGRECALPVEAVQEIVPMAALASAPGQPPIVEGFLNLRGTAVPVVRFDRLFGLPGEPPGLYTPLIVLKGSPQPTGLMVGAVKEIAAAPPEAWQPVGETGSLNGCARAEVRLGERDVSVLDPGRLIIEQERRRIEELQAGIQRRIEGVERA